MKSAKRTDAPGTSQAAADRCQAVRRALAEPGWTVHFARPDGSYSESLSGFHWLGPAPPPWDHQCTPQTRGREMNDKLLEPCACGAALADMLVERCTCGAIRHGHGGWHQRNQRRIDSARDPAPPPRDRRLLGSPWFTAAGLLLFTSAFVLAFLVTGGSLADLAHVIIP